MERLTNKKLKTMCNGSFVHFGSDKERVKYRMLAESAPKYEEIYKKLADYEDAEEQGLLLRLPVEMKKLDKKLVVGAMLQALNTLKYGFNGSELKSAAETSYALNQAYMRGRQDEIDRMNRIKAEAEQKLAEMGG